MTELKHCKQMYYKVFKHNTPYVYMKVNFVYTDSMLGLHDGYEFAPDQYYNKLTVILYIIVIKEVNQKGSKKRGVWNNA